ncbi:MAG: type II toxin-antitoxin system prevent-host-death family antitoxin [bacterium]|nr:type II toxin-antitoxin system prevent-host-death family antitoxin [bacterium]
MSIKTTNMRNARANFSATLEAVSSGDIVIIQRRGKKDAAVVDADLLEDWLAVQNPEYIKSIITARAETEEVPFVEVFKDIL